MTNRNTALIFLSVFFMIEVFACGSPAQVPTSSPTLPQSISTFKYPEEMSENEFLFVTLDDYESSCLDGLCSCPVSEAPIRSYKYADGILVLNKHYFNPIPSSWIEVRKNNNFIALYSFSSMWDSQLRLFPSLPIPTSESDFVIVGVNSQGQIEVRNQNEHSFIPVNSTISYERPEQKTEDCKVLHEYVLTNYGFIEDENVRFHQDGEDW
ncbi:MAG: hypothetical protein U0Z26_16570 [Anaerolineales bacterium]